MRLTVIGCGRLGATHAAGVAELGHEVVGVDVDSEKIRILNSGRSWFHEPDLDELLARHTATGRLRFTTGFADAAGFGEVHFLGVGTPVFPDRDVYDLSQVFAAVRSYAPHLERGCLVVGKSTVPVGTTDAVAELVRGLAPAGDQVEVAWNPEFLREGFAVADTLRPDRIVVGVRSPTAEKLLREVYEPITSTGCPLIVSDPATCELVKSAANAYLATKISFINAIAEVAEAVGADATLIAEAIGHDPRIGHSSLHPGLGYGGGCLPKDIRAFATRAAELGVGESIGFFRLVDTINQRRRTRAVDLARDLCGGTLAGRRVAVWGAAFKPDTDDIRDSPSLAVAGRLHDDGAVVTVYDPKALETARVGHPHLTYATTAVDAAMDAHVVILGTEWPEFRAMDPGEVGGVVAHRRLVDTRNVVDRDAWRLAGWTVRSLGRP